MPEQPVELPDAGPRIFPVEQPAVAALTVVLPCIVLAYPLVAEFALTHGDHAEFIKHLEGPGYAEHIAKRLQTAIERLSAQQRECILLRISGLRYREIADVLGINVASVGELITRATARLSEDIP